MASFSPAQMLIEPAARPDPLSTAVVQSLARAVNVKPAWGPVKTFVLGGLTFGLLPLFVWPKRFGQIVVAEQQQLKYLLDWLRGRRDGEQLAALQEALRDTGPAPTIWLIPAVAALVIFTQFVPWFFKSYFVPRMLLLATYEFRRNIFASPSPYEKHLYHVWTISLFVAYASHWLHVRQHAAEMKRVVKALKPMMPALPPLPPRAAWISPLWIVGAVVGCCFGAWWAIPAAMAGAAQRRYQWRTSLFFRGELARGVREMLRSQEPELDLPLAARAGRLCRNDRCRQALPPAAQFCPRCGTKMA